MGLKRGSAGSVGLRAELVQLAARLRREHLFVDSERRELQRLNERVQRSVERLQHLSWIWRQQRNALDALVMGREGSPASCCQRLNALEAACFVDAYRVLGPHEGAYAALLRGLRGEPGLVASCLVRGPPGQLQLAVDILVSCVYGCGTLAEDQALMLQLLRQLMVLQLEGCDNVRRLLQHGSCAFSRVYKAFTEGLPGAQLFLTAALRSALIQVLVDDDLYLDIDPSKAVVRFPPEERIRHFGPKDSPDYARRLGDYRAWTIDRLARLAQGFVDGLRSSWPWLPAPLAWLVRHLHATLTRNGASEDPRAGVVCADLVFAFFICPAVVSPELHGLVDTHITPIARFNLMQVAQIIQVLALSRWERPDSRLADLYDRFPRDCISSLLDSLLGDGGQASQSSLPASALPQREELARAAFLATEGQLTSLVSFLRSVTWPASESEPQKLLSSLLDHLPASCETSKQAAPKGSTPRKTADGEDDSATLDSQPEEVLVVPMPDFTLECPGMLSEEKVLSMEQQKRQTRVRMNVMADVCDGAAVETVEKRTRFSLSQDQESIGTSDNLEAVSEGASNHSVASSLELENENDNYSDMVSANVSGHGTPNVSGRDTPSSQVEEEEERPPTNQNQADIEDKFGKFEISPAAPVQGDETKSIVSDTWSTDVLASDSELLDQQQVTLAAQMQLLESHFQSTLEVADTGSDAWSTDVAASDNERLQDVDTDDTGSLARSDDTRSEVSGGGDEDIALPLVADRHAIRHSHHHHRHHRRSNLRPPPQSPKQPFFPQPLGAPAVSSTDGTATAAPTSTSPRGPLPSVDSILDSPRGPPALEQPSPTLDSAFAAPAQQGATSPATSGVAPLAPSELSFFDPLAVQVELRHPEKLRDPEAAALGGSGDGAEEDVTPTGTQATPSPSGGAATGDAVAPRASTPKGGGASPTPPSEGMQSLGRLSLAVKELPEEEALLLLQSEEEAVKVATEDERGADKKAKNFLKAKLSQFRFSFKPKQRKSNEVTTNGPDVLPRSVLPDVGSDAADILEKYRGAGPAMANGAVGGGGSSSGASPGGGASPLEAPPASSSSSSQPAGGERGGEESLVEDAQRKLRLVLALADLPQGGPQEPAALLQGLLAQATLLHNKTLASHVHEALRCLRLLDELQCLRVLRALEEEHRRRAPYVAYLVRCRQGLLAVQAQLETRLRRTQRDRDVCQTHLATLCVRHFLDPREARLQAFSRSFQGLTAADEKAQLVEQFLQHLFQQMEVDPTWQMASDVQINLAQRTVERAIMSQIYVHALYPNGDGDVLRDQVLHQHIQKLARVVTVDHRDLRIPRAYHAESPWPSAQAQLGALAAHKSPQDKVACVAACCASLASLLSAAGGAPAAADDLVPVLVFVLVRANPPHLLSTVQFVETFQRAGRCCQGEAAYWWTQFCAAIEFIKTMDY